MLTALLEQIVNGTMIGCIYVLMALGMVLIFGVMQVLNFAHGVLFMVGGYLCHFAFFKLTGSYPASIALSMLALAALGLLLERAVFRPLRDNIQMQIVASLGLILVIQNGVVALWGPQRAADARAGRGDDRAARPAQLHGCSISSSSARSPRP